LLSPILLGMLVVLVIAVGVLFILPTLTNSPTPTHTPTATQSPPAVADVDTTTPTVTGTEARPLTGLEILATSDAELTQTVQAQVIEQQTVDAQATTDAITTATQAAVNTAVAEMQASIDATETISWATLYARTASSTPTATFTSTHTPTFTPTQTPNGTQTLAAFARTPMPNNVAWMPIEQVIEGVKMVYVPTGCFMMGSADGSSDERPVEEVCITEPFWLDKTEVTQAQFVEQGGVKANANYFTGDNRPVEQITWTEAWVYCEQRGGRLPTEAEWEFAARGPDGLKYPWGNDWDAAKVVSGRSISQGTEVVGSKLAGASWVGALDLSGNVWEWTSSLYQGYPYKLDDGREDLGTSGNRVLRGGSWDNTDTDNLRGAYRDGSTSSLINVGFRCARSS